MAKLHKISAYNSKFMHIVKTTVIEPTVLTIAMNLIYCDSLQWKVLEVGSYTFEMNFVSVIPEHKNQTLKRDNTPRLLSPAYMRRFIYHPVLDI